MEVLLLLVLFCSVFFFLLHLAFLLDIRLGRVS